MKIRGGGIFFAGGFIVLMVWQNVHAEQITPGTIIRQLEDAEHYRQQQQQLDNSKKELPEIDLRNFESQQRPADNTIYFELNTIHINQSDIFSQQELTSLIQPYLHHPITLDDLNELINKINALYKKKGFFAAKAVLPPQKIKHGQVTIHLIESKVGTIHIQGNLSTNARFLTERLAVEEGDLVDIKNLEKQLDRLNVLTDIQVGVALKPGKQIGRTQYLLTVKEPQRHESFLYLDNSGSKDVGLYRYGFNYVNRSLTGNRDLLNLGGYGARGTSAAYAGYRFPVNRSGTMVNLNANVSTIHIVSGPIQSLDISGQSHVVSAGVTHYINADRQQIFSIGTGINNKQSTTSSSDVRLFKVTVNTLDFNLQKQFFSNTRTGNLSVKGTLTPHGWTNDKPFFRLNADGSYNTKLGDWLALFRFGSQWSDVRLLPSTEQFQVGGVYTVRGYPEGLLIGDRGYFASLTVSHAVHEHIQPLLGASARFLAFIDHGAAFAKKGNGEGKDRDDYLLSMGVGLDIPLTSTVAIHFIAGKPLMHRKDQQDAGRINFTLQANFH